MPNKSTKKRQADAGDEENFNDAEPASPEEGNQPPAQMKRVRVDRIEEFEEPVAPRPVAEAKLAVEPTPPVADQAPPPLSDAELLMQQAATDSEYLLRVDRLPNYSADGRIDTQAAREFCCNFSPVPLDVMDKIQRRYGGGDYLLTMFRRGDARGFVKRWYESIAQAIEPAPAEAPTPTAPQSNTASELDTAINVLEKLDRLANSRRRLMGEGQQQQATTQTATQSPFDAIDQTVTMVEKITAISERVNPPREEGGKVGIIGQFANLIDAVGRHAPKIAPVLQGVLASRLTPQQGQAPQVQQGYEQPPAVGPSLIPPPVGPSPSSLIDEIANLVADDIAAEASTDRALDKIVAFVEQSPVEAAGLLPLVSMDVDGITAWIAERTGDRRFKLLPYEMRAEYINELREGLTQALSGEEGSTEGEQGSE